jgi:hypothetical protein
MRKSTSEAGPEPRLASIPTASKMLGIGRSSTINAGNTGELTFAGCGERNPAITRHCSWTSKVPGDFKK